MKKENTMPQKGAAQQRPARPGTLTRLTLIAIAALLILGCATVEVHKLDADGHLDTNAPEGIRYYMPRPYVAVNEPFVIASSVFLAAGEMSPDGSFILLTEVSDELKNEIKINPALKNGTQKMGALSIDANTALVSTPPPAAAPPGGPQGAPAGNSNTNNANGNNSSTKPPATLGDNSAPPADGSAPATPGVSQTKVTNDNAAFAVTPLPRFFTIAWLPDWDEEYVITTKSRFGSATATINLGQGWGLQGLDAKTDNSAIVKPLLDLYSGTLGALQKVATAKIEGPLALVTGKPQGASAKTAPAATAKTEFAGGTLVTVKITKATVVAPGLYKILKPKEQVTAQGIAATTAPHIQRILAPLTDIPFVTYDVIVIEAARAVGDSAFTLGQYTETTSKSAVTTPPAANQSGNPNNPVKPPPQTPLSKAEKALNTVLAQPANTTAEGVYYQAKLTTDPKTGDALATIQSTNGGKPGTAKALPTDADLIQKLVIPTLAANSVTITAANITIKH